MTERRQLTAAELHELFTDLGARLGERDIDATLYVVGGAAMALAFDSRRLTADIDGLAKPAAEVYPVAREMAPGHGLTADWLSGSAQAWLPNLPDGWENDGIDYGNLRVVVATADVLLVMKMLTQRERDIDDLIVLVRALGITDPQEVVDRVHTAYPDGLGTQMPSDEDMLIDAQEIISLARR